MALTAKKVHPYLKSDDGSWFDAIFQQHWSRVYGVLFRIVGDHDEAEDLALETFWRLHERPTVQRDADWLVGWLYRVATNLGFNALRARQRRARYEEEAGHLQLEHMEYSDPAEEVQRSQEREMVRLVLARIKPRSAQLLILRHSGSILRRDCLSHGACTELYRHFISPGRARICEALCKSGIGTLLRLMIREVVASYGEGDSRAYP